MIGSLYEKPIDAPEVQSITHCAPRRRRRRRLDYTTLSASTVREGLKAARMFALFMAPARSVFVFGEAGRERGSGYKPVYRKLSRETGTDYEDHQKRD